ncbi:MAG: hypothetical protein JO362_16470 [Streptomycetaceae bacterium]|nr:hypothetical protein [Streptomycetaceae bacterium]
MLDPRELDAQDAELLPGREALGRLKFSFTKTTNITKHVANVHAHNESAALNSYSDYATAQSEAGQSIVIAQ